jgi:hypothetical protein
VKHEESDRKLQAAEALGAELPEWAVNCSKDATLIAWAIVRAVDEMKNVADAIDSVHQRLDGIEKSLK